MGDGVFIYPKVIKIIGDDGTIIDAIPVNSHNGLVTVSPAHISTDNSTTTPLTNAGVYTGTWEDITNFGIIIITVYADKASATDGLMVEFSSDGTNVDSSDVFTIPATTGKTFSFQCATKYFRVKYTNGAVAQTEFRLQTILKPYYVKPSSHRVADGISAQDDAELVKAVLTGKQPSGDFTNFQATTAGNFKVSLEEIENVISSNGNSQLNVTPFHADGTEGVLITGVEKKTGKDGVDSLTNTLQIIDYAHHEIHSGSMFRVQHNDDAIPAVGSNGELVIAFFVPDQTKQPHMVWETSHEGGMTITLYEGVTLNAGNGTDVACKQSNRNSANASVLQGVATGSLVSDYVTVGEESADNIINSLGTAISVKKDYAGRNEAGGQVRKNEVVLKTNTYYAFVLKNHETNTQGGQIRLEWYEHTPKN